MDLQGVVSLYSVWGSACCPGLGEIPRLHAAFPPLVVVGRDLMGTDRPRRVGYALTLFTMSDTDFGEHTFHAL
jgi:hypothetical protein